MIYQSYTFEALSKCHIVILMPGLKTKQNTKQKQVHQDCNEAVTNDVSISSQSLLS
eukprot:m.256779 g.256779  ORF g.256779 m.256779 type:complete len:56 (+) comp15524_c0_seq23:721-888(+)